jgi:small ligand-binding sensory domain FIST
VDVLVETLSELPEDVQPRAQQNLLVGLAVDEYRHEFARGDFLVRNIIGLDRGSGAIAIGALPRPGQTIQFQMRDAATADLDLTLMLDDLRPRLAEHTPIAAVLNSCNGRGVGLFGSSHHDATAIGHRLGPLPLAGLFCAGEIGPVGNASYLHGFTASLGVIVKNG